MGCDPKREPRISRRHGKSPCTSPGSCSQPSSSRSEMPSAEEITRQSSTVWTKYRRTSATILLYVHELVVSATISKLSTFAHLLVWKRLQLHKNDAHISAFPCLPTSNLTSPDIAESPLLSQVRPTQQHST